MRNVITIALLCLASGMINAQEWTTPIIEGYGKIKQLNDIASQPDTSLEYNIVFDVKDDRELDGVNVGLFKIARLINMLGTGGVPQDKIHIVAAVHGGATFAALNDQKYREKYNKANPNTELLQLLHDYGVKIYVCAQATASRGITADDLDTNTELGLSAMMVLANYQLKGYALMP